MDLFELLQRGYFPKELPPSFNTYKFALNADKYIGVVRGDDNLKKKSSAPALYSIEKSDVSRRAIHIPNPLNYLILAGVIVKNQLDIFNNIPNSSFSISKVYHNTDISDRCLVPRGFPIRMLKQETLKVAMAKKYEVKLDVANYYPSIYTHSITWALLGRNKAKKIWGMSSKERKAHSTDSDVHLYELGDAIDSSIRNCNENQTHGILIGPDISFLVGELIMSRIDNNLKAKQPQLKGFRFYDDYTLYVDTEEEADVIYQQLQAELRYFGLEINESKYQKKRFPFSIQDDYQRDINSVKLSKESTNRGDDLLDFFDVMWKCAQFDSSRTLTIFKYGLSVLINKQVKVDKSNKGLYEPLLYKTAVLKPSIIPQIVKILDFSVEKPTKELLSDAVSSILKSHVPFAQDNEVAWALWLCKKYELQLDKDMVCSIFKMDSTICTIILMDIIHSLQVELLDDKDVKEAIISISNTWNANSLYSEDWLLLYELSEQGWIDNSKIIKEDPFFKMLHDDGVKFYDPNAAADYKSYEYIETLPYDYYPKTVKDKTSTIVSEILDSVRDEAFNRFYDEETDMPEEGVRDFIESEIEDNEFENDLFGRIIQSVFKDEEFDQEDLINEYVRRIGYGMGY